ncbi:MAG: protein kinase domain-containing protein [Nocardioides sp.]
MIAGRYTLDREIGRGGMGAVWLGRDEVLGRDVALKRLGGLPSAGTPDFERAEREAKLAARLNHPHVVAVFDLVDDDGEQWLVMEHVEGLNLSALVKRDGPLTVDQASIVIRQAAEALTEAHAAGIVHRDVKPSNILLTPTGQVKLTDFGIARAEADASLTQTGLVTGSPAYLAPEVATGRMATDASDVWALGATLYHALEGSPPYDAGDNVLGAMYKIVNEEPPRPTHAGWLAPLMLATMAKDPADRWTMLQVRQFLTQGPQGGPPGPVPTDPTMAMSATPTVPATVPAPGAPAAETSGPAPMPATRAGGRRSRRPRALVPLLAVACVVVLALIVGALVLANRGDTETPVATDDPSPSESESSPAPSPSEPTETDTSAADAERAEAMTAFVTDYLNTVVDDPKEAWERLTPDFQKSSGGFGTYKKFWDPYDTATIDNIGADPATGIVSYSVRYTNEDGGGFDDTVELQLEENGDSFLIAGEG